MSKLLNGQMTTLDEDDAIRIENFLGIHVLPQIERVGPSYSEGTKEIAEFFEEHPACRDGFLQFIRSLHPPRDSQRIT